MKNFRGKAGNGAEDFPGSSLPARQLQVGIVNLDKILYRADK